MDTLLLITGMHRSGTSALCAALQACGAVFGEHLLSPMAGVNDEGFWEDRDVVALNDALLAAIDSHWYDITLVERFIDWHATEFDSHRDQAKAILARGFAGDESQIPAVKDPRFCITLPFWQQVCEQMGIACHVCVIDRPPLEVARSLKTRDAFPVGYGLRLYLAYWQQLRQTLPQGAVLTRFHALLADPVAAVAELAEYLPITLNELAVRAAVRQDLRHQHAQAQSPDSDNLDMLTQYIDQHYPVSQVAMAGVDALVARGRELTALGEQHTQALATLDQRDLDVRELDARLNATGNELAAALETLNTRDDEIKNLDQRLAKAGAELEYAMNTVTERDAQIEDFDTRLQGLGAEHQKALDTLNERDATIAEKVAAMHEQQVRLNETQVQLNETQAQLQDMQARFNRLLKIPVFGAAVRKLWFYERR